MHRMTQRLIAVEVILLQVLCHDAPRVYLKVRVPSVLLLH